MNDDMNAPVRLVEDEATGDRFLVYGSDQEMRLDIRFEGDTLWMTQAQIAELFGRDQSVISRHISSILSDEELDAETSMQKVHKSQGRPLVFYNLDMIISVGYRVSSKQATAFRRWATSVLVQYARKGFVVDSIRLKNPENADRIKELREIIRDIRSDEANVYRELREICAMCQDYDADSGRTLEFYKRTQAKLIYAVTSNTPAEVVMSRADHTSPNMGLQAWPHKNIRKTDTTVSKNYLTQAELSELNRLTTILLDIFEDQAALGRLVLISEAEMLLDLQLTNLGRVVLKSGGGVKKEDADQAAVDHYTRFKENQRQLRHDQADKSIQALAKEAKKLPKNPRRT